MSEREDRVRDMTRLAPSELEFLRLKLLEDIRKWVEPHVRGAIDSLNHDMVANSEHLEHSLTELQKQLTEIDAILRGKKGDNGLSSDLRILRASIDRVETEARRRSAREWAVILLLLGVLVKEVAQALIS